MIDRFIREESCAAVLLPEFCNPETPNFAYFEHYIDKIYIDRNHNQNLTDDGPPLILGRNNKDRFSGPGVITVLGVPYASGEVFPYGIILWTDENLSKGAHYKGASTWMGYAETPSRERILVGLVDVNLDGVFNSGTAPHNYLVQDLLDIACIDLDRNGILNECVKTEGERVNPVYPGEQFELDGAQHTILVAPSGHKVTLFTEQAITPGLSAADFDGDGAVGFSDFLLFAGAFGLSRGDTGFEARYDLDGDGAVGFSDLLIFAESFGKLVSFRGSDST